MLPFSKRPPAPEEYLLNSGDFQALPPAHANPSIPPPPHAPIFARQRDVTPHGFVQHYGDNLHSVPPPAHSLAPVAMGSHVGSAHTGSHPSQVTLKEKPSLKWGLVIALTGAVLGGVIGVGMDAKRQQQSAASASQQESAPGTPAAAPLPAPLPVTSTIIAKPAGQPAAQPAVAAGQPAVIPPQPPVIVGSSAKDGKPAPEAKNDKPEAKKTVVGRRFFGHPVGAKPAKPAFEEREEAPAPVAKKAPAPAPEKAAAPEKAPEKAAEKKAPAAKTDAQKVLEEAVKNTANTL